MPRFGCCSAGLWAVAPSAVPAAPRYRGDRSAWWRTRACAAVQCWAAPPQRRRRMLVIQHMAAPQITM